ncbi:MAG: hypothetical protein AB7N70_36200 [Dehalococcoidia bacterium]
MIKKCWPEVHAWGHDPRTFNPFTWGRFIAAAVALLIAIPLQAGTNTWTSIGPVGGYMRGLAYNASRANVAYTVSERDFYRSSDNGATWQASPHAFRETLYAMAADPGNGDVVYVVEGSRGMWRSSDQGQTFNFVGPVGTCLVIKLVISGDGSRLLVACGLDGRILSSSDGGSSWQDRTPILQPGQTVTYFPALAIHPVNRDILFAGRFGGGIYKSVDGGLSWSQVFAGPGSPLDFGIYIDPNNGNRVLLAADGLLQSLDGGATWLAVNTAAGPVAAFDPSDPDKLYVGSIASAVFRTTDGGIQWDLRNWNDGVTCGWISQLLVNPRNSQQILGAGDESVCRSDDGGATWSNSATGILHSRIEALRTAPSGPRRVLVGLSPGQAYVSSGTAGPWVRLLKYVGNAPSGVISVEFVPGATASSWLVGQRLGNVLRTVDSGANWLLGDRFSLPYYDLAADAVIPGRWYGATYYGVMRSDDGGATWANLIMPPAFGDFNAVAVGPGNPGVVYAGAGFRNPGATQGVVKSLDGGSTWVVVSSGIETQSINRIAVSPTDANTAYAGGNTGLFKTTNGGQSWVQVQSLDPRSIRPEDVVIDPNHPEIIYVAHGFLSRSVNAGQDWQVIYEAPDNQLDLRRIAIDPVTPNVIYGGTRESGVKVMEIVPDLELTVDSASVDVAEGAVSRVTYQLRNNGPFAAAHVIMTGDWPVAATSVSVQTPHGTCSSTAASFDCSIGALQSGEVASVALDVAFSAGNVDVNVSTSGYERDANLANNSAQTTFAVGAVNDVGVTATVSASTLTSGQAVSVSSQVTNAGPSVANDVIATYDLAALLRASSITSTRGACSLNGSRITCELGVLPAGENASVTFSVTASASGTAAIDANVTGSAADSDTSNNHASISLTIKDSASTGGGGGGAIDLETLAAIALLAALGAALRNNAGVGSWRARRDWNS